MNKKLKNFMNSCGFYIDPYDTEATMKEVEFLCEKLIEECAKLCNDLQEVPASEPRHCAHSILENFGLAP